MGSISSRELSEWFALDRIEPLDDSWAQHGQLAALVHNAWFEGKPKKPSDFIPAALPRREQSAAEAQANMLAFAAAWGAARAKRG